MTSSGFIAFQIHSINDIKDNGKKVMWKNIKIIETRLDGWQLKSFKESYDFKIKNGISLVKKKRLEEIE